MKTQTGGYFTEIKKISQLNIIGIIIAMLVLIASGSGLLIRNIYDPFVHGQLSSLLVGQDIVAFISAPVLLLALFLTRQKSAAGPILWTGVLLFTAYAYSLLAFGAVYNHLFFIYLAIIGLSVYSIYQMVTGIHLEKYMGSKDTKTFRCLKGIFLITTGVLVFIAWIFVLSRTIFTQAPIPGINTVYVLDMTLLLPACIITGIQQLRQTTWSYFLSGALLVKVVTLGLSILLGYGISIIDGRQINIGLGLMFGLLTISAGALLFKEFRRISP